MRPSWKGERREWESVLEEGETLSSFLRAAAELEVRRRQEERERQEEERARFAADPLASLNALLERARGV